MKKLALALALAAAATLGMAAPSFAAEAGAPALKTSPAAQTDVSAQRRVERIVIRRPHFGRRGKRVVIKHRPNGTTVKKVFRHGRLVKKVVRR